MTTAAIAWQDGDHMRVAELSEGSPNFVGRAPGSMVMLDDKTVSRQQAMIRHQDGAFMVENLSTTNPTRLNDQPLDGQARLKDGDVINISSLRLTFNDLAATGTISGPNCSHCQRENSLTDKDCWYCGTSLVNAPTTIKERRLAACRVISSSQQTYDVYPDQVLALKAGGDAEVGHAEKLPPDTAATVEPAAAGVNLHIQSGEVLLGAEPATDGAALHSGDEVSVAGARYTLIIR